MPRLDKNNKVYIVSPAPQYTASQIRELRKALHLTQRVFASIMGVSIKTVEAWESGTNHPSGPARRLMSIFEKDKTILTQLGIVVGS